MKFFESARVAASWETLRLDVLPTPPAFERYRHELDSRYSNGRVVALSMKVLAGLELFELLTPDNWRFAKITSELWNKIPVVSVVGSAIRADVGETFHVSDPFELASSLASRICAGGAYSERISFIEGFRLAVPAVDDVTSQSALVLVSDVAWSSFFSDVAWDLTVIIADNPMVTLLMATDHD